MTLDMLAWRLQLRLENPAALRQLRRQPWENTMENTWKTLGNNLENTSILVRSNHSLGKYLICIYIYILVIGN